MANETPSVPYVHQPYPAVRYRRAEDGKIETKVVASLDEEKALGKGWFDSPAGVAAPRRAAPTPPTPPTLPTPPPPAPETPAPETPATK